MCARRQQPVWQQGDLAICADVCDRGSDTRVTASAGTGFKAPTLGELYQNFPPFFFANPDLKPETSTGYDLGIDQGLFDQSVRLGATWFRNDIRDLITTDVTGSTYANVGRARAQGVESFIDGIRCGIALAGRLHLHPGRR